MNAQRGKLVSGGRLQVPADLRRELGLAVADLDLFIVPFDAEQAILTGRLRRDTRAAGLLLGDRACLALAMILGATAVTTDTAWTNPKLSVEVELAR